MKLIFAHLLHTCAFWCVASCCSAEWTAWKVQIMNRNCDPMNHISLVTMKFSLFNFRKYIWVENNQRLLDKSKKQDELYAMKCWRMFVRQVFCLETKKNDTHVKILDENTNVGEKLTALGWKCQLVPSPMQLSPIQVKRKEKDISRKRHFKVYQRKGEGGLFNNQSYMREGIFILEI